MHLFGQILALAALLSGVGVVAGPAAAQDQADSDFAKRVFAAKWPDCRARDEAEQDQDTTSRRNPCNGAIC